MPLAPSPTGRRLYMDREHYSWKQDSGVTYVEPRLIGCRPMNVWLLIMLLMSCFAERL